MSLAGNEEQLASDSRKCFEGPREYGEGSAAQGGRC